MTQNETENANEATPAEQLAELREGDVVEFNYMRDETRAGGGVYKVIEVVNDEEIWVNSEADDYKEEYGKDEDGGIWRATEDGSVKETTASGPLNVPYVANIEVVGRTPEARAEEIAERLAEVETPALDHDEARILHEGMEDTETCIETQSSEDFWDAWCEVVEALREAISERESFDAEHHIGNEAESYDEVTVRDDELSVSVLYRHTGTLKMLAEDLNEGVVVYEDNIDTEEGST